MGSVTLGTDDLHVKMGKTTCGGQSQFDHPFHRNSVSVQVIKKGAVLMVIRHQPELSPRAVVWKLEYTFQQGCSAFEATQAFTAFHSQS